MPQINNTVLTDTFEKFVDDHNSVKNRLGLGSNNGETTELGAIALFDRQLNTSLTIPNGKGALGVDTIIPVGVTLTVEPGGVVAIL